MLDLFIATFISLFVIIDPIGTASVFATVTQNKTAEICKRIAVRACIIAICILAVFALIGEGLLHHLGISLPAFRVAGGTLLFVTAFRMIMGGSGTDALMQGQEDEVHADEKSSLSLAVFPIAIPLLAGPGCMTAIVLHSSEASNLSGIGVVIGAAIIVQMLALIAMLTSVKLVSFIGQTGSSIAARIVGVLLAALAVQFIADGVKGLMV